MKVIYRSWREDRDFDKEGNSNVFFKNLIRSLKLKLGQIQYNKYTSDGRLIPPSYQSFDIPENIYELHCIDNEISYWDTIAAIIQACNLAEQNDNDSFSDLWKIELFLDMSKSNLNLEVPAGINNRTITTVNENGEEITEVLTWANYNNNNQGVNTRLWEYVDENENNRAILHIKKNGKFLNRKEILILYQLSLQNNDIKLLNTRQKTEIFNQYINIDG